MRHRVSIRVGTRVVDRWTRYSVDIDMMQPADGFHLVFGGPTRELYDICQPDEEVQVFLDRTPLITGFIDDREWTDARSGTELRVIGRDKVGRLLDESAPLTSFVGMSIKQLAEKMAAPWFGEVVLSNATNRRLLRGSASPQARASQEPPIDSSPRPDRKVSPGESRWQVLSRYLEEAGLLAWSTADGKQLVVGKPNYDQEPQYRLFKPKPGSSRMRSGNVIEMRVTHSVSERYSMIVAMGAGRGDSANYGERVTKHQGVAKDHEIDDEGVGGDFLRRKVLYISDDDVRGAQQALERARREMRQRDATGHSLEVIVDGHSQTLRGQEFFYAFDTQAHVENESLGLAGLYLVTSVSYGMDRQSEQTTTLRLVPQGTELV